MKDEEDRVNRLIRSVEYAALRTLRPEFSLFGLLDDALREPAWSRLFSGILDSTLPHALGSKSLRSWLSVIDKELHTKGKCLPTTFRSFSPDPIIRSAVEFRTPKGRRIDVLIRLLDSDHHVRAVIGIENKLGSPEQPAQISDYQAALTECYPRANQLILYVTPDGREARTADAGSSCPYLPVSYQTMVDACRTLASEAAPKVALLLESLCSEIEESVLGESRMNKDAKSLVRKLWGDPDHRRAMRFIIECVPTRRKTWQFELEKQVGPKFRQFGFELAEETPITFYPKGSESPREIKFECGGEVGRKAALSGLGLHYILHCSDSEPDAGSEFALRLMAWCTSNASRKLADSMNLDRDVPPIGAPRHWSSWRNIWTGSSYILQDADEADVKGLASILCEGVRLTWPVLMKRFET